MKKVASMVGIGAMIFALGMGSSYAAQQQAAQEPVTISAVSGQAASGDTEKSKAAVTEPETGVKAEKADPGTASATKAKGTQVPAGAGSEVKPEVTAPSKPSDVKPGGQNKPEATAPVMPSTEEAGADTAPAKSGTDLKAEKVSDTKAAAETQADKGATVKPAEEKPSDKNGDAKPAKQQ